MNVADYLAVLRKRWLAVLSVTAATLAAAALITLTTTPLYAASTELFFATRGANSISDLNQGSSFAEAQMTSYARVATSPLVLDPVTEELDLPVTGRELAESVTASVPANTVVLVITATDEDPERAAAIANAVADQLGTAAQQVAPDSEDGTSAVVATVLTPAAVPESADSPNAVMNLVLGLLLGLVLAVALALLRELASTKIRDPKDVAAVTDTAVLGSVAMDSSIEHHPVFVSTDPHGAGAESMRRLRTNLTFVDLVDSPQSIVITSSVPGEGKSTTAVNLAVALADTGAKVLLVDADLRRPSVARYMGLEGRVGLTTILIGRADPASVAIPYRGTTLDVLPAGQVPPNPSELLGSRAMTTLLERLTSTYDMVLLDSPPLLAVTDAVVLSKSAGGTLLVAGADRIHRGQLRESLAALEAVNAKILGIVVNKHRRQRSAGYYYRSYEPRPEHVIVEEPPPPPPRKAKRPPASPGRTTAPSRRR